MENKNKVLFCATVDYHFKLFHLPTMEWFSKRGWEVHVAAQGELELPFVHQKRDFPIQRSPFRLHNIRAYRMLKEWIDSENYQLIHCHTPMGGVLARLAARHARRRGTKVVYTAHGFHFFKGAPLPNWLIYYPIEKQLAKLTDCLITINSEDYRLAVDRSFRAGQIAHVHGVGVHTGRFSPVSDEEKRRRRARFHYRPEHFLLIYAAEFNRNKNHELLLHALAQLKEKAPMTRLLLAGRGPLLSRCRLLAQELGVSHMVSFLGYRDDLDQLLPMCDTAVSSSLREGLPVNIMEAMACGLPIVATRNRGHEELVEEGRNGFLVGPTDASTLAQRLGMLQAFPSARLQMGENSKLRVESYSSHRVQEELRRKYEDIIEASGEEVKGLQWEA
ncbi:glycosyltransferase family 4 protein [Paenibacillus sp. J5C_2022]|uniref:glycosyltransferase family 4 protein n=1 Tax=Paenibacillus sp. J5C2022 TaxID=2977129 RepID=UPI0021D1D80A|nr:glycosyltransferase family 4 protein [Paenibacillus sp. J5C2022]MCU6710305.1 glycosyltransferase family 4 protein [Paenibacillus sp. J5C2022]